MHEITPEFVARLFDGHAAALELYAAQWSRSPADVVQDAFVQLVKQPRTPDHPVAWLYQVVRNRSTSIARSDGRRRQRETDTHDATANWFVPSHDGLDAATAASALRSLPEDLREVVITRIWGGLTFEEIAGVLGSSPSTVHRKYETALAALRERLGVTWLTTTAKT